MPRREIVLFPTKPTQLQARHVHDVPDWNGPGLAGQVMDAMIDGVADAMVAEQREQPNGNKWTPFEIQCWAEQHPFTVLCVAKLAEFAGQPTDKSRDGWWHRAFVACTKLADGESAPWAIEIPEEAPIAPPGAAEAATEVDDGGPTDADLGIDTPSTPDAATQFDEGVGDAIVENEAAHSGEFQDEDTAADGESPDATNETEAKKEVTA